MFIIVFTMILIVATMIYIIFTKIGNVMKRLKYACVNWYIIAQNNPQDPRDPWRRKRPLRAQ